MIEPDIVTKLLIAFSPLQFLYHAHTKVIEVFGPVRIKDETKEEIKKQAGTEHIVLFAKRGNRENYN